MRVNESSNAEQLVKIFAESAKTSQEIGTAILKKQHDVQKNTGNAIVQLLQSAASLPDSGTRFDARA
jgi:hypothetical protein